MVYSSTIDSAINAIWDSQAVLSVMTISHTVLDALESEMFDQFDRINLIRFDLNANQNADIAAHSAEENSEPKKPETDIKGAALYDSTQIDGFWRNEFKLRKKTKKTFLTVLSFQHCYIKLCKLLKKIFPAQIYHCE